MVVKIEPPLYLQVVMCKEKLIMYSQEVFTCVGLDEDIVHCVM